MGTNKKELVNERDKLLEKRDIMNFWLDGREKEIKSLRKELKRLGKKRVVKIQSEEKLKKLKRKRLYLLGGFVASMVSIFAPAAFLSIDTLSYPYLLLGIVCALCGSYCVAEQVIIHLDICDVKEMAKLSLAEIDEKIRELEEALQLQEDKKNNAMMELETIHQALGEIDQRIRAADFGAIYQELAKFDRRVSTPQNGMDDLIQDDLELSNLEQADTRQDDLGNVGLDQDDTKENGLSLARTYKETK